ncbi:ETX/MTX2 family pore-forming toxin [Candidatus Enterococcus ikei]|uniref:ETX/MTX2 family pore-forming toxin n=1 Tax=Candidatus Enterococcus ikei TaxID=2815326 RepID=A0ABS3GZA8_9ENTE|nr:ETX/MTX2 family pore-forming toxin [Enterococcus sp. DIV0869a]MBO0440593.1 ETX/MTX2 family pore-forming toxin [Enterococcus sp. DIV0869a]
MKKIFYYMITSIMCLSSVGAVASIAEAEVEKQNSTPVQNNLLVKQDTGTRLSGLEQPKYQLMMMGQCIGIYRQAINSLPPGSVPTLTYPGDFEAYDNHVRVYDITHDNLQPKYIDMNTFVNDSDEEQVFTSVSRNEVIEESETSTITQNYSLGAESSVSFDLMVNASSTIRFQADFNKEDSSTKSHTETFTVPAQNTRVPAHKKYRLELVVSRVSTKAAIKLTSKIKAKVYFAESNGSLWYLKHVGIAYDEYKFAERMYPELVPSGFADNFEAVYNLRDAILYDGGFGHVEAVYGSEYNVRTLDVTNGEENAVIVNEQKLELVRQ